MLRRAVTRIASFTAGRSIVAFAPQALASASAQSFAVFAPASVRFLAYQQGGSGGRREGGSRPPKKDYGPEVPSDSLYCANLSVDVTEEELRTHFSKYGNVKEVKIPTDRETGQARGFAFVTFSSVAEATAAKETEAGNSQGRNAIVIRFRQPMEARAPGQGFERSREPRAPTPVNPPSTRLFVANLGSANENQLMQALGAHKPVSKPVIVNDRETQRSKGFGFLEFATVDEAKAALAHLATVTMQGRMSPVVVNFALERPPSSERPPRS